MIVLHSISSQSLKSVQPVVKDSMQQQLYVLVLYLGPQVQVIQRLTILDGQ